MTTPGNPPPRESPTTANGGATERAGGGLTGLRDRVEALGGSFTIDSPAGQGTRIAAAIPAAPAGRPD